MGPDFPRGFVINGLIIVVACWWLMLNIIRMTGAASGFCNRGNQIIYDIEGGKPTNEVWASVRSRFFWHVLNWSAHKKFFNFWPAEIHMYMGIIYIVVTLMEFDTSGQTLTAHFGHIIWLDDQNSQSGICNPMLVVIVASHIRLRALLIMQRIEMA